MLSSEIIYLITTYKYYILFPILVFEGPVTTMILGFWASQSGTAFHIIPLFFFVFFADICGDTMYYLIGRFGGRKIILWLEDRLSKKGIVKMGKEDYLTRLERYFKNHGGVTIILSKISHGLGWPVMVAAGSVKLNYKRFISFCTITSLFKTASLLAIGYFFGEDYSYVAFYLGSVTSAITIALVLGAILYFVFLSKKE